MSTTTKYLPALLFESVLYLFFFAKITFALTTSVNPSAVPVVSSNLGATDFQQIKEEIDNLKDSNYQNALAAAKNSSDNFNTYMVALSVVATLFGVGFAVGAIFLAWNFKKMKDEMDAQVKEMSGIVTLARAKAQEIDTYQVEAKQIIKETLQKIVKDIDATRKKGDEIITELQKAKQTGKELEALKKRYAENREKELDLSRQLVQSATDLGTLTSRASIFSSTPSVNPLYYATNIANIPGSNVSLTAPSTIPDYRNVPYMGPFPVEQTASKKAEQTPTQT